MMWSIVSTVFLQYQILTFLHLPYAFYNLHNKEPQNTAENKINLLPTIELLPSNQMPVRQLRR